MAQSLYQALMSLVKSIEDTEKLVANADQWSQVRLPAGVPKFSVKHKDMVTELAFLRVFLAWELFIEETFLLYLIGKNPPKGRAPYRFVFPPNRKTAVGLVIPEGRDFVHWTTAQTIVARSERFFRDGKPFSPVLRGQLNALNEMRIIRNAIAHWQNIPQEKFKSLVRNKSTTGTFPKGLTIGAFLTGIIPRSTPPETFFDRYVANIRFLARKIVPG
ncbi:MAG: hypothetical protein ACXW3C_06020 [Pyrinomonadaceae bacterium]